MKILITGGSGSLGKALARTMTDHKLRIYSRDEMKQHYMEKDYPDCDYYLGDVRDLDRLRLAARGVDCIIHAAALKIVPKGETDPFEYVKTNVGGAENVIKVALDLQIKKVVALSTDKAVAPVNLYGATKLCSDKLFLAANNYNLHGVPGFSVVRYGNVMGSRGSVLPLFMEQAQTTRVLTITDPGMTRFMITLEQAVDLIIKAIDEKPGLHIPQIPSINILTLAEAICETYNIKHNFKNIGIRPGEKLHESLTETYHSNENDTWMTKKELKHWLLTYNKSQSKMPHFSIGY